MSIALAAVVYTPFFPTREAITRSVLRRSSLPPTAGSRRYRDGRLTFVPISDTNVTNLAQLIGRPPGDAGGRGKSVPAGGGSSLPFSGGSGKTPGRHHDRSARSSLDWDRPVSGNGLMSAASQEARSRAERRRWFAAASAAVERRQASASRWTRAAPPPLSSPPQAKEDAGGGAEVGHTRLSAFRLPDFMRRA